MQLSDRPRRGKGFLMQELDDELILYHPEKSRALCLSQSASLIWNLCDGSTTVGEIVDLLHEAFPDAADIEGDVREALERFAAHTSLQVA